MTLVADCGASDCAGVPEEVQQVQSAEGRVQSAECRVQSAECRVQRCKIWCTGAADMVVLKC
jgi:hypothetical protein